MSIKSPTGRAVNIRDDRCIVLLNCRHWYQSVDTHPQGAQWVCERCQRVRLVAACLTMWETASDQG